MNQKEINSYKEKLCIQELQKPLIMSEMDKWDALIICLSDWKAQRLNKDEITAKSLLFCAKNKINSVFALPYIEYYTSRDDDIPHSCKTEIKKNNCSKDCGIYKYKEQNPRDAKQQ